MANLNFVEKEGGARVRDPVPEKESRHAKYCKLVEKVHRRKFEDQANRMFALLTLFALIFCNFLTPVIRILACSTDRRKKGVRSDAEASPKELVSCKKRFAAFLSVSIFFRSLLAT